VDAFALRAFQREVALQCQIALATAEDIDRALVELASLGAAERDMGSHFMAKLQDDSLDAATRQTLMQDQQLQRQTYAERRDALTTRLWGGIQALLVASANISKLLWPADAPKGYSSWNHNRFPDLRDSLGVDDAWMLKSKDLRNVFEHYDEYLDRLGSADNPNNLMADLIIGDFNRAISGLSAKSLYRSFNPQTGDLHFWDKSLNLRDLVSELQRLIAIAQPLADTPHWQ
jgi:hypothetical protein